VGLLWFLSGLGVGLLLLRWSQVRLQTKLQRLLNQQGFHDYSSSLPPLHQVSTLIEQLQASNQALNSQVQAWQQILQNAPLSYLQVDDQNQLLWSNSHACQLLKIEGPSPRPTNPRLLLELVRSYELDQLIESARSLQRPCHQDWIFQPSSVYPGYLSQKLPLRGFAFPLAAGAVGVFLENRQEVVKLTQERDRWTSDVAHELKTPLTSIRLVAETLQPRIETGLRLWVDRLLNETIRLSTLVQDLLDLSQLALRLPTDLNWTTLDLSKLIGAAWLNLEPLVNAKHLQLKYTGPSPLTMHGDEARLYRVFLNLLDNSIKYSPPGQTIWVQVHLLSETTPDKAEETQPLPAQHQIRIDVIDAGPGFPEQALPYVFERFYRADPARSRQQTLNVIDSNPPPSIDSAQSKASQTPAVSGGSGLGLAIVRQIIETHNGLVQAQNHPETGGAWLQIWLPRQPMVGDEG
jgi:two-component system, OmpR family, phosphate regulon sensor histidine kinase PhoR